MHSIRNFIGETSLRTYLPLVSRAMWHTLPLGERCKAGSSGAIWHKYAARGNASQMCRKRQYGTNMPLGAMQHKCAAEGKVQVGSPGGNLAQMCCLGQYGTNLPLEARCKADSLGGNARGNAAQMYRKGQCGTNVAQVAMWHKYATRGNAA